MVPVRERRQKPTENLRNTVAARVHRGMVNGGNRLGARTIAVVWDRNKECEEKINPQPSFLVINHSADISKERSPIGSPRDGRAAAETFPPRIR